MKGGLRRAVASDDLGVPQRTGLDSLQTEVGVAAPGGAGVVCSPALLLSSLEDNVLSGYQICKDEGYSSQGNQMS